jgi:hypothetical protein
MLRRLADSKEPTSFANKLRAKRFRQFEALAARLPRPLRLLDVGGTNVFWENRGWHRRRDVEILTLNLVAEQQRHPNIKPLVGDARDLGQFGDRSIDVIFSNSVIEHLFTFENQRRMASEIQRVGKAFWVQTPNYWFPIEPHFHIIGWQWLPVALRVSVLRRRTCGWRGPCPDPVDARRMVEEVQLLTRNELRELFPHANIIPERFYGLVKSWIALGGFN